MEMNGAYLHTASQDRNSNKKGLLKEKLELETVRSKDGSKRVTVKKIEDELTFDKGFYVFIRALQLLKSHNEGVVLVGLAGPSGSGKTAFSERVSSFMPGVSIISMDNYNDASKLVDSNFDDPRLTDYDLLLQNLADLRAGKAAQVPIYDYKVSSRTGYQTVEVPNSRIVVIEGIYALSERLRPLLDLRVSITGGVHFDLIKRVLRDISRSGQGPEEIIQQVTETVYPMYKAFIEPDLQTAQLKIVNSFNPFTGFMNATYILKARRPAELEQQAISVALGGSCESAAASEMVDIHLLPPNEDPESCQSWLRMRNRDGRYTLMFEEWVTEGPFIISPRITFEVGVRVLGGLMSLGYTIGACLRRTTSSFQASGDGSVLVKLDTVAGLGQFVQVQGKSRDSVQAVAQALGLFEFIPHSYIEQVQLGQLTEEFQEVSHDVAKRFSMNGTNLLNEGQLFGSSPPSGSSWGVRRGPLQRSASGPAPSLPLSMSAPVGTSMPIPISGSSRSGKGTSSGGGSSNGAAGAEGPEAQPGAAAAAAGDAPGSSTSRSGTPTAGTGASSLRAHGSGLLSQQLRQPSPGTGLPPVDPSTAGSWGSAGAGSAAGGSSWSEACDGSVAGGAPSSGMQRVGSRGELAGALRLQQAGASSSSSNGAGGGGGGVPPQVVKQLEVLGEAARRYSGLQLQMEAMSHQYRQMNEQLSALTMATQALGQQLHEHQVQQQLQQQQQQQPYFDFQHMGTSAWLEVVAAGLIAMGCMALGGYVAASKRR